MQKRAIVMVIDFHYHHSNGNQLIEWCFFFRADQLKDDDECALGRHNCAKPFECRNTKGSFRCEKPRIVTTTSTTTTSTTTTTTKRPYIHTQYYPSPPTYTQSYSSRFTAWPHTTPNPRHIEYDQRYGPCSVGFQRNGQGACVGKLNSIVLHLNCMKKIVEKCAHL